MSKFLVVVADGNQNVVIGEAEFDLTDFTQDEYKYRTLNLKKSPNNNFFDFQPEETHLEIGLKGII